jgi:hypothetical protein
MILLAGPYILETIYLLFIIFTHGYMDMHYAILYYTQCSTNKNLPKKLTPEPEFVNVYEAKESIPRN